MLTITVPPSELFDDEKQEFLVQDGIVLELEHSLVSLSKWESFFEKAFLTNEQKTQEETRYYVKCMVLTPDVPDEVFERLSDDNLIAINRYIESKMSATWFREDNRPARKSSEVITSELIYYWMLTMNIDISCENWHLNRLLTLVKIVNAKNAPSKKMSRRDLASRNQALNQARRQQLGTTG